VALNAEYYAQRASAGLIITEATNVSPNSAAFELAPAIYNDAQVAGWRGVTEQVHAAGGKMFMQLWHSGRVSSYALLGGAEPLSPSGYNDDLGLLQVYGALRNGSYTRIYASPSRAMSNAEVYAAVAEFRAGAVNASAPASMVWRSTPPTAICRSSSCRRWSTAAPTSLAAASRTARASCAW
jgi:N-ethylmaleimide reductase